MASLLGDPRANEDARRLLLTATALFPIVAIVFGTRSAHWLRVPVAYCLPMLLVYPLLLTFLLYLRGRALLPRLVFTAGLLLIVAGGVLEIAAAARGGAGAETEVYPIVNALADSGHSTTFAYWYAIVMQGLVTAILGLLWAGLLRHRLTLILSTRASGARDGISLLKAALGAGRLSWRSLLFPRRRADLPSAYHVAWLAAALVLGTVPLRILLGLQGLGLAAIVNRRAVLACSMVLSLGGYLAWLLSASSPPRSRVENVAP